MLEDLRQIVQAVDSAPSFAEALAEIVCRVCLTMGTEVCSVYLVDRRSGRYRYVANEGLNTGPVGNFALDPGQGLVTLVGERAEPINLENATRHSRYHHVAEIGEDELNAFLGVPIIHQRQLLGVLVVQQRERRRFDDEEEAFLVTLSAQLAGLVATAEATGNSDALGGSGELPQDTRFEGIAGAPGIGMGTAVVMNAGGALELVPDRDADNTAAEIAAFDEAIERVRRDIEQLRIALKNLPEEEKLLFEAYLGMLDDTAMAGDIRVAIRHGQWAQGAVRDVVLQHVQSFERMKDSYLSERAADVRELGERVLRYLQDIHQPAPEDLPQDTILVSNQVSAAMLADIPPEKLVGVVSTKGSVTSHAAIMCEAMAVPTVMGAVEFPTQTIDGQRLIVDGFYGEVFANPGRALIDHYRQLIDEEREFASELEELRDLPCMTRDGHAISLWVNIGLFGEITRSLDHGAEGIGLFRTEVPFATKDRFPTEEEQRVIYREHMVAFEPRPVTMRTLDVGGDKALSYFSVSEDNPFLGWRGIRVTLDHPEIFLSQVRAMIKANAGLKGLLRIMLPMISNIDEVDEAVQLIQRAHREVVEEGFDVKRPLVGVMIEVPAAVYQARLIAKKVDFLAVGTNDLTQYMLAVDRNNPRVANLYRELHPAVLLALRLVAVAAHGENKGVGTCGELAGTPEGAVLLVGMGYDVLSMNATNLPRIKWVIRNVSMRDCRRIVSRVLKMDRADEIQEFVRDQLIGAGLGRVVPLHELPLIL